MPTSVSYNNPNLPQGMEVAVEGLGVLVNGQSVSFDDEQLAVFEAFCKMPAADGIARIPFTGGYVAPPVVTDTPAPAEDGEGGEMNA